MNDGLANSWKSIYEKEAIRAILREATFVAELNIYSDLVNLQNGMYNLKTHKLEKHHPRYLSTVRIPIIYNRSAKCPKFLHFMDEITNNDSDLIKVHQELIGYWITTEIKSEKAVYYYGRGANGKSVLANLVKILVGNENVSTIPLAQFNSNFGLEGIMNKTLNVAAENEMNGLKLNTETFKAIVSGDGITINIKFKSPIVNYKSKCRLLFLGNELPDTSDLTQGYFRRLIIIPFKRTFKEEERNRDILQELQEELDGIFNWAIEGLVRLNQLEFNFTKADAIESEMAKYQLMQNPVLNFFESTVVLSGNLKIKRSEIYKLYLEWIEKNGLYNSVRNNRQFKKEFENVLDSKGILIIEKRIDGYDHIAGMSFNI
ncbi:DNA primase [Lysinibacillus sphaericus]|uniref:Primase, putative n=2 Tax=Lysinibacillus TaxID=400634 RepID=B1HPJ0_LYSSC|nr:MULTISPECIES: phage/plasmid primase, P4 family [Lysinibacillus]MBE5086002.1 DNA primase [Bacillus thuringiensis]ACA42192.1 primase, putative [Lysinibacillus sphaericus C3-41]AMO31558.1 hypothetical protein AR327_03170 [Lysinibacillus sphaericus]AMR89327.1 hypothetical protein A1T07_03500 [Lysinibacillus sphaericus]ANA47398.1 hypothetical protein A2J09_18710 [Lysinibacillus sphaericus]